MTIGLFSKLCVFTFLITVISCSSKPQKSRKPVSQITIENKSVSGQDLVIGVDTKIKEGNLDKTRVFIDDKLVATKTELTFKQIIEKYPLVGKHTIKIIATKTDGTAGINYKVFEVFSDIVPEKYGYRVVNSFPHNVKNFTEGLEIKDGFLYESTGENGASGIYKMNLKTGQLLQSVELDSEYFGEGITIFNDKIFQLTYKHKKGFIYDLKSFKQTGTFAFESEQGWGMTHDNQYLIMGDGTHVLTYLDPSSLASVKKLQVYDHKGSIQYLNELEYINGFIYANIWTTDLIVKIEASTGKVLQTIDLKGLLGTYSDQGIEVLNGIAIDHSNGNMYVTGKYWPKIFQIELIKKE